MGRSHEQTDIETSIAEKKDLDFAREFFPEGSTVYCIIRHVSRSNMSREIGLVRIMLDHTDTRDSPSRFLIRHPNVVAARVLGRRLNKQRDGIKISGCGMDMGLALVSALASKLYGSEQALRHEWL